MEMKIATDRLLELLMQDHGRFVEASLNDGIFNATHFLRFGGRKVFDTGIDSVTVSWKKSDFLFHYSQAKWKIDQIV